METDGTTLIKYLRGSNDVTGRPIGRGLKEFIRKRTEATVRSEGEDLQKVAVAIYESGSDIIGIFRGVNTNGLCIAFYNQGVWHWKCNFPPNKIKIPMPEIQCVWVHGNPRVMACYPIHLRDGVPVRFYHQTRASTVLYSATWKLIGGAVHYGWISDES